MTRSERLAETPKDIQPNLKTVNFGLRGENLRFVTGRPAVRHTSGAREAQRAQQF